MGQTPIQTVVIAGGGTGGHLIPGLAVARELVARGVQRIVFVGTARGVERALVPAAGFDLELIEVGGLKRVGWQKTWRTLRALPKAVGQCRRILSETAAPVVLGIGGYASGPMLLAAARARRRVVLLEINARAGLANRLAARWADAAAVAFPETVRQFRRAVVTGVPVRQVFFSAAAPAPGDPPQLLVFGGSQGARAINQAMVAAARIWNAKGVPIRALHQTGVGEYNRVLELYREAGVEVADPARGGGETAAEAYVRTATAAKTAIRVRAFIDDMAGAMAQASLIVCRSGASTLGELAASGRAALLIPFPGATDAHQLRNARAYQAAGAAAVLEQKELNGERLAAEVEGLLAAPERRAAMADAVRQWSRPDAAGAIADLVLESGAHSGGDAGAEGRTETRQ
ncbi:MAG: undecaprenyldiphospho-muramoylpentapeptide beta-N-acetylglucosaminyltransferase [Terriglobales bacterium]